MSYSALSHGGVARVSTMVVDAPLDMGGFAVKTPTIEEAVAGAGVLIDEPRRSHKWFAVPAARVRYENPAVFSETIPDSSETIIFTGGVNVAYLPGSKMNVKVLAKTLYAGMKVKIGADEKPITDPAGTELFFNDVPIVGGVDVDIIGVNVFGSPGFVSVQDITVYCEDTTVGMMEINSDW